MTTKSASSNTDWFTRGRFGMFIHFGLYSVAGRHEWVRGTEKLTPEHYQRYFDNFEADLFDASALAKMAKGAGCTYVVLTTKHHEGFCLWGTKQTDYNSVSACGRDLLAEYVDAVRAEGLKVGLYHSVIDWNHPDYTVDRFHPLRDGDLAALNADRDMGRYRTYLWSQVREILTGYGDIDLMFYDFTYPDDDPVYGRGKYPEDWDADGLLHLTRELQPGIVINNRLGIPGDYVTPEQFQPTEPITVDGVEQVWEACHTINGSWGYDRDNLHVKSVPQLVGLLIKSVGQNGNVILNVGPDGRGGIDPRDADRFAQVGEWMRLHNKAIYGAGRSEFVPPNGVLYTQRGNRLYAHIMDWPLDYIHLPDLAGKVSFARLLNDGAELVVEQHEGGEIVDNTRPNAQPAGTITVRLPVERPEVVVPVVELTLV